MPIQNMHIKRIERTLVKEGDTVTTQRSYVKTQLYKANGKSHRFLSVALVQVIMTFFII